MMTRKRLVHLLWRTQKELIAFHAHARAIRSKFTRIDTQHHVLGRSVFAVDIMCITCRHEWQAHPVRYGDRTLHRSVLDINPIIHNLNEVTVFENSVEPLADGHR